jgi:MFS family permease
MTGGWLGDRIGHRQVQVIASVVSCLGSILLVWARTPTTLMIFGGIFGMGIGLFLTANWALANSAAPQDQAGKFMGLTNLATAGAGAMARLGGPLIDWGNAAAPGQWLGYVGMFIFSAVFTLVSILFIKKID